MALMRQYQNVFLCGVEEGALMKFIAKIAPQCSQCRYPKTDICVEKCCSSQPLYCRECEKDRHFLHRSNDIRMLLIDRSLISSSQLLQAERLTVLLRHLEGKRDLTQAIIDQQRTLLELYNANIEEVKTKLEFLNHSKWHTAFYETIAQFIDEKIAPMQARRQVARQIDKMDIYLLDTVELTSLKKTVEHLSMTERVLREATNSFEQLQKLQTWNIASNRLETVVLSTACEVFIGNSQKFSLTSSVDRSIILKAQELGFNVIMAKRVKILGNLAEDVAQRVDLSTILPVTAELELSFLPRQFPPNLKRLWMRVTERTTNVSYYQGLFPQTLKDVNFSAENNNFADSLQIIQELSKLEKLKTLDICFQNCLWKGIRNVVRFAKTNQLQWLAFAGGKMRWGDFEYGTEYNDHVKGIRLAHQMALSQVTLMHKSKAIEGLCSQFREGLLDALSTEVG